MDLCIINLDPTTWVWSWALVIQIIALICGIYEVIIRIWPTFGDITIIGNIIKFLRWLSDLLNNKNQKGKNFETVQKQCMDKIKKDFELIN